MAGQPLCSQCRNAHVTIVSSLLINQCYLDQLLRMYLYSIACSDNLEPSESSAAPSCKRQLLLIWLLVDAGDNAWRERVACLSERLYLDHRGEEKRGVLSGQTKPVQVILVHSQSLCRVRYGVPKSYREQAPVVALDNGTVAGNGQLPTRLVAASRLDNQCFEKTQATRFGLRRQPVACAPCCQKPVSQNYEYGNTGMGRPSTRRSQARHVAKESDQRPQFKSTLYSYSVLRPHIKTLRAAFSRLETYILELVAQQLEMCEARHRAMKGQCMYEYPDSVRKECASYSTLASRGRETFGVRVHAWASLISCGTPHLPIQPTANGTPCYRRNWLYQRVPSPSQRIRRKHGCSWEVEVWHQRGYKEGYGWKNEMLTRDEHSAPGWTVDVGYGWRKRYQELPTAKSREAAWWIRSGTRTWAKCRQKKDGGHLHAVAVQALRKSSMHACNELRRSKVVLGSKQHSAVQRRIALASQKHSQHLIHTLNPAAVTSAIAAAGTQALGTSREQCVLPSVCPVQKPPVPSAHSAAYCSAPDPTSSPACSIREYEYLRRNASYRVQQVPPPASNAHTGRRLAPLLPLPYKFSHTKSSHTNRTRVFVATQRAYLLASLPIFNTAGNALNLCGRIGE
ncbi:uncharacterized protein TRIVIDRAFT_206437 [Trichoderma virens Gv29-8]|uniref:Uncharacterized protein n=1 Tax=Hypocrea virens (strain Gv29-8 / FGSC 10586) TaxID=413071 RepID=G9NA90_HYPVG|nr:uncharacterized protein TRIVIDRAFT_206437 [Trichoderma virens Gv29-8]EHK16856.1 hypothetical protein TRIVIDRAFT_206437 [Trichoderma virens Gv29-8]